MYRQLLPFRDLPALGGKPYCKAAPPLDLCLVSVYVLHARERTALVGVRSSRASWLAGWLLGWLAGWLAGSWLV